MSQDFHLSILQECSPQSHVYIGELWRPVYKSSTGAMAYLTKAVRDYIKSRQEFKSWGEDVDYIHFVVREVRAR